MLLFFTMGFSTLYYRLQHRYTPILSLDDQGVTYHVSDFRMQDKGSIAWKNITHITIESRRMGHKWHPECICITWHTKRHQVTTEIPLYLVRATPSQLIEAFAQYRPLDLSPFWLFFFRYIYRFRRVIYGILLILGFILLRWQRGG